jgi:hypothetical protein
MYLKHRASKIFEIQEIPKRSKGLRPLRKRDWFTIQTHALAAISLSQCLHTKIPRLAAYHRRRRRSIWWTGKKYFTITSNTDSKMMRTLKGLPDARCAVQN